MKMNIKLVFLLPVIFLTAFSIYAQNPELTLEKGVAAHKEIDAVYGQFSEAYRTLDFEKVSNLYSENAAYLPPDSEILKGREQIRPTFQSFFDWVKKEGRTMTISFRIFQRKVEKNLGYDVGIYTITQYKDGKNLGSGEGKFIVVAVKEKDGKWRFQVDGYNNLKPENKQEVVEKLTLEKETIFTICLWSGWTGDSCTEEGLNVKVEFFSENAGKDKLNYYYTVSGGKIIGNGANVIWNFSNGKPGKYTITAGVGIDDKISGKPITKIIELKECDICESFCECPTISVTSSKKTVYIGETVEFTVAVNGGSQTDINYNWTVENGTVIEGQGTTKIKVRALSGENVTATVEIGGLCENCMQTDSESVKIIK